MALPSLGDRLWLLPCVSPLASLTPLLSAGARGGSGCEMLLGEAWADRLELGTALKPCYWHTVLARRCDSWLQAHRSTVLALLEAGLSLCLQLGYAGEPGLAQHCSRSPWHGNSQRPQTAPARSSGNSRAPFISASFLQACHAHRCPHPAAPWSRERCVLGMGWLPTPARSRRVPQVPGPFGCCSACCGRAPVSTAPATTLAALPCLHARSCSLHAAGLPFAERLAVFCVSGLPP